jgi:hypothetical protein
MSNHARKTLDYSSTPGAMSWPARGISTIDPRLLFRHPFDWAPVDVFVGPGARQG